MDNGQEKKAVEQTIQVFFDGIDNLDSELIKQAFYSEKTQLISVKSDTEPINISDIEHFIETVAAIKKDASNIFNTEKCEKSIEYIDITGSAASAKVRLKFSTFVYTDYYNLLKLGNAWKIVNKTFDTEVF